MADLLRNLRHRLRYSATIAAVSVDVGCLQPAAAKMRAAGCSYSRVIEQVGACFRIFAFSLRRKVFALSHFVFLFEQKEAVSLARFEVLLKRRGLNCHLAQVQERFSS